MTVPTTAIRTRLWAGKPRSAMGDVGGDDELYNRYSNDDNDDDDADDGFMMVVMMTRRTVATDLELWE